MTILETKSEQDIIVSWMNVHDFYVKRLLKKFYKKVQLLNLTGNKKKTDKMMQNNDADNVLQE